MSHSRSNIVLIGMPGSGKSAIGLMLAKMASMDFVDTDSLIRMSEGRSLQDIVDTNGHMALREIEERVLLGVSHRRHVIATGGSAVYSQRGMEHLRRTGAIVFLHVSLETLKSRIEDYETRGLAKAPGQTLEDLFQERAELYNRYADLTIECAGLDEEAICRTIIEELKGLGLLG
ncbi:MAG: shikimate kinase [Syntrophobacteraceae bacterium]